MTIDRDERTKTELEDEARTNLYLSFFDEQCRRAYLMLGDSSVAADVVHAAIEATAAKGAVVHDSERYLSRGVLYGCRQEIRTETRRRTILAEASRSGRAKLKTESSDGRSVDRLVLAEALLLLPYRQRAAVVLKYYGGHTETEISEVLGCREGTVGPLISRAKKQLRRSFDNEG